MRFDINDVLPKLKGVKRCGDGWIACCPSHDDRKQSLSIGLGDDGKALIHCHTGCRYVQVVQDLGLFEHERNEQKKKRKIVAAYDYQDENGELLYQVVRYEGKDFRLRKPNGMGGWNWSLQDTRKVLYRLPEVLQARGNNSFVIFCEGEKDVDNVREKFDFPATTIATGANAWKDEYADFLQGLNVVILPDNDKTGKEFAERVANSIYGKAQSVIVVNLPNLPDKGDVSDWIESGGTRQELIELIDAAPEWQVTNSVKEADYKMDNFFIIKSANEWIKEAQLKPIPKMLFGELWFEDELCILFADSNVGKSLLAVQIADSITKGKAIGDFPLEVEPQKVLYFDFELNDRQFSNRYGENKNGFLVNEHRFSKDFLRVAINPDADFSGEATFEECLVNQIESAVTETGVKILIIDNLTYLKTDNERAKDALPLMQKLKALKNKYQLSIMVLAHTPKRDLSREITQNDLAGSKMLINFCDSAFAIGKSTKGESIRYVKQIKERNTGKIYGSDNVCVAEIVKTDNFLSLNFFSFGDEKEHLKEKNKADKKESIQQVVDLKEQNKSHREIAAIVGYSIGSVTNYLNEAAELGIVASSSVHPVQPFSDLNKVNDLNIEKELELPF
jgi:5S rRNA maturation endonuclease (ribonuclease M5)